MITAEEAKKYAKEFNPPKEMIDSIESQIKNGNLDIRFWTTHYCRDFAERCARFFRNLGYNAYIKDVYNIRTGARGGNYLKIEL